VVSYELYAVSGEQLLNDFVRCQYYMVFSDRQRIAAG
jgi:hypothetical protein